MKKIFRNMMALAIAAFAFTACEDVPEPYAVPTPAEEEEVTYTGDGTLDNPYTCTDAIKFAESLNGDESENEVYIKGKISEITEQFTTQYGNGTFKMSDDGLAANEFTAYRVLYLGNKKFANGNTQIQVGDEVIVCGKVVNYRGNTPETVQGSAYLYSLNGVSAGGGSTPTGTPTGTGTLADPFNAAAAIAYAQQVGDAESPNDVYIKGKVSSIADQFNTQYGNATFTLSDDGTSATTEFTVYRALYLGNQKYTSGDQLNVGDEVIVCGKVTNYRGNTPETVQGKAYLYSLNGKTEGTGGGNTQSEGELGTADAPITVAAALIVINSLGDGKTTDAEAYVKGKITSISEVSTSYGNATYIISDEGVGNTLTVFRGYSLGGQKFASENEIKVGDEVVVKGKLQKYVKDGNITPEIANGSSIIKLNGNSAGGSDNPQNGGSDVTTLTNGDFETWADELPTGWKSASTASSATLTQSTDAHGGNYSCNINGKEASNVRLATQEITLTAGTYNFSFWVKPTTEDASQVRPGYVAVVNGAVSGSYQYGDYATLSSGWQQVSYDFTLTAETTVCLVVMNPKKSSYSSGKDVLIDDAVLTKK